MAYTKAREVLRIATDKHGMSYDDVAQLCGVSLGSVKRWMMNGRADPAAIKPLLDKVGTVYLSASQVADHLQSLYAAGPRENRRRQNVRRLSLTAIQLAKIAGRQRLKAAFLEEISEELKDRGFLFEQGIGNFIMVSWKWLNGSCAEILDDELRDYFIDLAEDIDEDEEEAE
jgi:transcriptional regulator with XRE-family HTH domain